MLTPKAVQIDPFPVERALSSLFFVPYLAVLLNSTLLRHKVHAFEGGDQQTPVSSLAEPDVFDLSSITKPVGFCAFTNPHSTMRKSSRDGRGNANVGYISLSVDSSPGEADRSEL